MDQTQTSTADEEVGPDTAPSEKSAKQTQPDTKTETETEEVYLIDEMTKLPDSDLIKIGLAAMAILHQRSDPSSNQEDPDQS